MGGAPAVSAVVEMGFPFQETRRNFGLVHRQMGELAAFRISNCAEDMARGVRLTAHGPEGVTIFAWISAAS